MKKKRFYICFFVLIGCFSGYALSEDERNEIRKTATIIASYFDSFPRREHWEKLHSYGPQAIPVVNELIYTIDPLKRSKVVVVFSQLKGDDTAVRMGLRSYLESCKDSEINRDAMMAALYCLERKGNEADVEFIRRFESHTNVYVSGTARRARGDLENRLRQQEITRKQSGIPQSAQAVPNGTGVVDKTPRMIVPQEVVAPNVQPNQKRTSRKAFPYLVVIGGILLGILGFLLVVTRKRPRKSE